MSTISCFSECVFRLANISSEIMEIKGIKQLLSEKEAMAEKGAMAEKEALAENEGEVWHGDFHPGGRMRIATITAVARAFTAGNRTRLRQQGRSLQWNKSRLIVANLCES